MKNSSNSTSLVAELGASYDASQNASKKQQENFLNEQLKSIKKELGQDVLDSKQKLKANPKVTQRKCQYSRISRFLTKE
jgi:ATP-dependent Lon protease